MKKILSKENTSGFENKTHLVKIISCTAILLFFSVVGLLFFARPTVSENEKRNLAAFPSFTFESFFSGEYFSQISLWYSDTYPMREGMIEANAELKSHYGIESDGFISTGGGNTTIENSGDVERIENIYLQKDTKTAYEILYNTKSVNDVYISLINSASEQLGSKVNVYDMVVPLHYTYKLTTEQQNSIGASDCNEVVNYIYDNLNKGITTIDANSKLMEHKDEYLYFRTDHHWTALGAYYAYTAFCEQKGITPTQLSAYEQVSFDGFTGTYSTQTNSSILTDNPDTVVAYIPNGTNLLSCIDTDGTQKELAIVYKGASKYDSGNKYLCFLGGDHRVDTIHNPNKNDGSSIVVVKESYGNAFVPFLVDSYEYVYVIDYRYYQGNLIDFVKENDIDDVLFLNRVTTTSSTSLLDKMKNIIE